jgi:outer membrane protein, multidrug efflux system
MKLKCVYYLSQIFIMDMTFMLKQITRLSFIIGILSGCSFIPPKPKIELPVSTGYPKYGISATNNQIAHELTWKDFFKDDSLKKLIELSLENNKDLRQAVLKIEEARATYDIQSTESYPSIGLNSSVSKNKPVGDANARTNYQVGFAATAFELDFFGRVKSLKEAALNQFLSTQEARNSLHITLIGQVANLYFDERAIQQQILIAQNALNGREKSYRLSKKRFELGDTSNVEVQQYKILVESAKLAMLNATRQQRQIHNALTILTGQNNIEQLLPQDNKNLNASELLSPIKEGVPSDLLAYRPDIKIAEYQLLAANANIGAAKAAFFPRISLTANLGLASPDLLDLFKSSAFNWSIAPQLLLPIFDAGRNRRNLDLAQIRKEQSIVNYEKSIQTAFREVADALAIRSTIQEELQAQNDIQKAQSERVRLANVRYKNGIGNAIEILDAERELFSAQQALIQLQVLHIKNSIDLYKSLGGGLT